MRALCAVEVAPGRVCGQTDEYHHGGPDFDSCKCGDYRHQHLEGTGRCRMPNDLTHGFVGCHAFHLSRANHPFAVAAPPAEEG